MFFKSISQLNEHIYKLLSYIFCQTDKVVQRQDINHLLRMQNFSKKLLFLSPPPPPIRTCTCTYQVEGGSAFGKILRTY